MATQGVVPRVRVTANWGCRKQLMYIVKGVGLTRIPELLGNS